MKDDQYQDCDVCGERYHGEFTRYLIERVGADGEIEVVCRHHNKTREYIIEYTDALHRVMRIKVSARSFREAVRILPSYARDTAREVQ